VDSKFRDFVTFICRQPPEEFRQLIRFEGCLMLDFRPRRKAVANLDRGVPDYPAMPGGVSKYLPGDNLHPAFKIGPSVNLDE
jgi:hypothetical protein